MAVADINLIGWETGDATRVQATSGTVSVASSEQRTGAYALRSNPTAGTGFHTIRGISATGVAANIARTAETFYTVYLKIASLPDTTVAILAVQSSAVSSAIEVRLTNGGQVQLFGTAGAAAVATLSADAAYHRLDLRVTSNGTSGLKVDGGTETTVTAFNVTQDQVRIGILAGATADLYFDDLVIGTTSPGGDVAIERMAPDGNGSQTSGWTGGTATGGSYLHVDEVPHDSDTTYWQASGSTTARRTVTLESAVSAGISGTVHAVAGVAIVRDEGGSSGWGITMRNGTTNSDKTTADFGASYIALSHLRTTDPNGGGAWATGGLDTLEVGVIADDITACRCTMLMAEVAFTPAPPASFTPRLSLLGVG